MKKLLITSICAFYSWFSFTQDTFSIVAVDTATQEVGSAGASCINGSIIISDLHPGVGAIHTQSFWNAANQNYASGLMNNGSSPQQIIDSLVANDAQNNSTDRQYGVVDLNNNNPRSAAFTGINCFDEKYHKTGFNYSIQGNILIDSSIIDSIESRFLNATGSLADKLMAALQGANSAGADSRCLADGTSSKSSFIRVAKPSDTDCYFLHINVNSVPIGVEPIDSLQNLYDEVSNCANYNPVIDKGRDTIDLNFFNGSLWVSNIGSPSSCLSWDMGDGTVIDNSTLGISANSYTHTYQSTGTYTIKLISKNMNCVDTAYSTIVVINDILNPTSSISKKESNKVTIYPNPSSSDVNIRLSPNNSYQKIEIQTLEGKILEKIQIENNILNYNWSSKYRSGLFYIRIFGEHNVHTEKIEIIN